MTLTRTIPTARGEAHIHVDRSRHPVATLALGHGAGGSSAARDLAALAAALPKYGVSVFRVDQPYRVAGKRVAPAAAVLDECWIAALNTIARESNEEALASDGRPSDSFVLDRIDARALGAFLVLLMATVAYEGELMDVCAYDQPGVEAYKRIMKVKLGS